MKNTSCDNKSATEWIEAGLCFNLVFFLLHNQRVHMTDNVRNHWCHNFRSWKDRVFYPCQSHIFLHNPLSNRESPDTYVVVMISMTKTEGEDSMSTAERKQHCFAWLFVVSATWSAKTCAILALPLCPTVCWNGKRTDEYVCHCKVDPTEKNLHSFVLLFWLGFLFNRNGKII